MKLTVIVPVFNEEVDIRDCLESVKWADDIFVVDSFSTDRTLEIAAEYTSHIVQHEYVNSAAQKNWAIPQVKTEWIMVLDADERVTEDLKTRIQEILRSDNACDGYRIRRLTRFFGKTIHHCGWHREYIVRLWKNGKGRYPDRSVHSDLIVDGQLGKIDQFILHDTYKNFDDYIEKFHRYTTWSANDLYKKGARPSVLNLMFRPLFRFFKMYVLQHGFLDGRHGIVLCGLAAFTVFTRYSKLWNMYRELGPPSSGAKNIPKNNDAPG